MRLLVTSVGSISAVGLILCLEPVRGAVRIVGTSSLAEAAGNFLTDRTVLVPRTAEADAWRKAVTRLVEEEDPDLVLNGRDEELGILGELRDRSRSPTPHYLVPPARFDRLFNDKYETARFAREHGLPFADTAYAADEVEALVGRHGLPVVVKPRRGGTGARNAFAACAPEEVRAAQAEGACVFQEMLPSPSLQAGIEAWKRQSGIPWAWALRSVDHEVDLLVDRGVVALCMSSGLAVGALNSDLRLLDEPAMKAAGQAWGKALAEIGHQGPVNMQGRLLPDGRYVPFELNARFTGTMIGKARLGQNLVLAALKHWCGFPETDGSVTGEPDTLVQRLPLFIGLKERDVRGLAETGEWNRAAPAPDTPMV